LQLERLRPLGIERVWAWLAIRDPLFLTAVPDASGRVAVVSQDGVIVTVPGDPLADKGAAETFLDIRDRVNRGGSEEGLLGLAFHPKFAENGRFYVYYSAARPRRSVISEFKPDARGRADPAGERIILEVAQPYANHNGGMIAFGPDGMLYAGLGDGGSAGDPHGHGQDVNTLLGSVLRIDVDRQAGSKMYGIPRGNPFERGGGAPEIWAYGLRNPWRFSFDRATGDLWVGDVGQDTLEEIDIVRAGGNYGWNVMEGDLCFQPRQGCSTRGLEMPVTVYGRGDGCSVTGGYVYRGRRLPSLYGAYVYGDYCSGKVWAVRYDGSKVTERLLIADTDLSITSFGEDGSGEVYIVDGKGRIYRFAAP
jgi:glucose/arabinose dehydrogenase